MLLKRVPLNFFKEMTTYIFLSVCPKGAGNNDAKAQEVLRKIKEETLNDKVEFLYCDLASMRSIRQFVQQFRMKNIPLHVLVNNAGVMMVPQRKTQDGFEEHFGLNYLGHFLLTNLLLDLLKESGSPSRGARVITISSATHYVGEMNMDDLQSRSHWQMGSNPQVWNTSSGDETIQSLSDGKVRIQTERNHKISKSSLLHPSMANLIHNYYSPHGAYAQSKLALVLFSYHLQGLLASEGSHVTSNVVDPGVVNTDLYQHVFWGTRLLQKIFGWLLFKCHSKKRRGHTERPRREG
ncbi:polyprenol dehydrogenase-like isoform X2 [Dasypus novemcinctus]|uniref:polyprenol dehydrogenase-like isoform X2 n=1 Tax=Dasypus novemcinctus TaxID=9361 RepID=UPI0039C8EC47